MSDPIDLLSKLRAERDRAVGAVLLMAYEGHISEGRARELLGMDVWQQRAEFARIAAGLGSDMCPEEQG